MELQDALLDSWDRQCRIVNAVASLVTEENRHFAPEDGGWDMSQQLAHMHSVRRYFLSEVAPEQGGFLPEVHAKTNSSVEEIRAALVGSGGAVRAAFEAAMQTGQPMKSDTVTYEHPVLFLQHMVWHDGWHVGQIFLALRRNGQEPSEEWDEPNVWGQWRTETWE